MPLLNPVSAAIEAEDLNLSIPEPAQDGRINTLNSMGGSYKKLSEFTENFIAYVKQYTKPKILEIGCAYGEGCLQIMKQCDVDYTAVDIDERHLKILAKRVKEEVPDKLESLTLISGRFPEGDVVKNLEEESYDFILTENVLHFVETKELYETFHQFHRLLKPEGRLFSSFSTPYLGIVKKDVVQKFESDVSIFLSSNQKCDPDYKVPMYVHDYRSILDPEVLSEAQMDEWLMPQGGGFLFDTRIARYFLEKECFIIEKCDYKAIEREPFKLDGRERIELVAKKPREITLPNI